MHEYVREAFYTARYERRPTVLGVPYDLQKVTYVGRPRVQAVRGVHPAARPHAAEPRGGRHAGRQDRERQEADDHRRPRRGGLRRQGRDRGAGRGRRRAARDHVARPRDVRLESLFRGRRRRLRQRRGARAVRGRGPRDRDRREPHILHCRRRRPVPEGLCGADRRAAARAARRHAGGRPVPEGAMPRPAPKPSPRNCSGAASTTPAIARPRLRNGSGRRRSIRSSSRSRPAPSIRATSSRSSTA